MRLAAHVLPLDRRVLVASLATLLLALAGALVPPLIVAAVCREGAVALHAGGVAIVAGLAGWRLDRRPAENVTGREALVVAALAYPLFSLAGAIVFLPVAGGLDGFFESMSGFTTTGLSVLDVARLPTSLLFFRAWSQWLGGAGILAVVRIALLPPGPATVRLLRVEGGPDRSNRGPTSTLRGVLRVYVALTVLAVTAYAAVGIAPFDALLLALSTISTGGFAPTPDSLAGASTPAALTVTVFMMAGATSFPLYLVLFRDGPRTALADPQLRALTLVAIAAVGLWWAAGGDGRAALFHTASALSTTGFQVSDPGAWSARERSLSIVLMTVGGCAGSTAGGIKLLRMVLLTGLIVQSVRRQLLPEEATIPVRLGRSVVEAPELARTGAFLALYLAALALSTTLLTAGGHAVEAALFESASALGTVGLSCGLTSPDLPAWARIVLIVDMWAGRLEILTVLAILHPATWKMMKS